jgi:uncharacterized membrane protein
VDRYLARLAEGLGSLTPEDRQEIVQEIRHHITDAVAAGKSLDAVLESLGSAEALARAYAVDSLLHPKQKRRMPALERAFKILGLIAIGGIPSIVIVAVLGSIGISFVASGVAVFVVGLLEATHVHLPGISMQVPPIFAIVGGPVMFVLGITAVAGLVAYVRFIFRTIRRVLPKRVPA